MEHFDSIQWKRQRNNVAASFAQYDFLWRAVAERLVDRITDTALSYPTVLDFGSYIGGLAPMLMGFKGISRIIHADIAPAMLQSIDGETLLLNHPSTIVLDNNSINAVLSCLFLHNDNSPVKTFREIHRILAPNGLFLAAIPALGTLDTVASALMQAETQILGGASPRIHPFTHVKEVGNALMDAGFDTPITDADTIIVQYQDPMHIFNDLKGMGAASILMRRVRTFTPASVFKRACAILEESRTAEGIPVSFSFCFITAWKK